MNEAEVRMLQEYWDETVNAPRPWQVTFSVNYINEPERLTEQHSVTVSAKSFAETSNKFIMETFQITNYTVVDRFEDGYQLAEVTFKVGPDFSRTARIRTLDQYSALHVLVTDVVKLEEVADAVLGAGGGA